MKKTRNTYYVLLISVLLSLILTCIFNRHQRRVIKSWMQPEEIKYSSFDPYFISVVTADLDWGSFPVIITRNYYVFVGSDALMPPPGKKIDFSFFPPAADKKEIDLFIKRSQVEWTNDGVIFRPPSGAELIIPKSLFVTDR